MQLIAHATLLITTLFLIASFHSSARAQKCLDYGPTVSLTGKLQSKIFAGPPNYESIKRGDRKERAIIVTLISPICTSSSNSDSFDTPEANIRAVQLVVRESSHWKTVERRLGRPVIVTGALFHGHTGHHRTKVLIDVTDIRPA